MPSIPTGYSALWTPAWVDFSPTEIGVNLVKLGSDIWAVSDGQGQKLSFTGTAPPVLSIVDTFVYTDDLFATRNAIVHGTSIWFTTRLTPLGSHAIWEWPGTGSPTNQHTVTDGAASWGEGPPESVVASDGTDIYVAYTQSRGDGPGAGLKVRKYNAGSWDDQNFYCNVNQAHGPIGSCTDGSYWYVSAGTEVDAVLQAALATNNPAGTYISYGDDNLSPGYVPVFFNGSVYFLARNWMTAELVLVGYNVATGAKTLVNLDSQFPGISVVTLVDATTHLYALGSSGVFRSNGVDTSTWSVVYSNV